MRTRFGRGARWVVLCEDLPEVTNRVELSSTLVDGSGIPAPKVTYRVSDDARRADRVEHRAGRRIAHRGRRPHHRRRGQRNNSHLLGTARMGDDRATSVVDRWGMTHDVPNLGIIDGSVFVTVGAVNPTSTICALASRVVDHSLARRAEVPAARALPALRAPPPAPDVDTR